MTNQRKKLFKFSVRQLVILMLLVAIVAFIIDRNSGRVARQERQIENLRRKGYVVFCYTFTESEYYSQQSPVYWLPTWGGESSSALTCGIHIKGDFETLEELDLTEFETIKELRLHSDSLNSIKGLQAFPALVDFGCDSDKLTSSDLDSLSNTSIARLYLGCPKVSALGFIDSMPCLEVLNLQALKHLRVANFENATQLWDLRFFACHELHSITGLPSSLKYLSVNECPKLVSIDRLELLPKFEDMSIKNCPKLQGEQLEKIKAIFRGHTVEESEEHGYWGYK